VGEQDRQAVDRFDPRRPTVADKGHGVTTKDYRALVVACVGAASLTGGYALGKLLPQPDPPKPEVRYLTRTVEVPTVRYWPSEPKIVTVYTEREPIPHPTDCVVMRWR
jgi:hypothetical protein